MILVNGTLQNTVSALDRGLSYGDGLFETIAVKDGRPLLWDLHWQRLKAGCERLNINCPEESLLLNDVEQIMNLADNRSQLRSVIKLIVTRGIGGRGYRYDTAMQSTRITLLSDWPAYKGTEKNKGIRAMLCNTRLSRQPLLAGMKHLNRLEQVMARSEWSDSNITEGLMLDDDNNIIEGTMSNVFFVDHQQSIVTPVLNQCGIAGVRREQIMSLAEEKGYTIKITEMPISKLVDFNEVFITNSLIGIWPIVAIDDHEFTIGPVTKALQALIRD